jgi:nucleotide-binding universal stress UspA family protein
MTTITYFFDVSHLFQIRHPILLSLQILKMKTIIAPTDFSKISINAVKYAADMARSLKANLLVLHATEVPGVVSEDNLLNTEEKLFNLKRKLARRTKDTIKIYAKQVSGTIENELIKICKYKDPLAVVMATHGNGVITRFFSESITLYLSKHLQYPVVVVPEGVSYKPIRKIVLATDMKSIYELPLDQITSLLTGFNATLHVVHVNKNNEGSSENSIEALFLRNHLRMLNPQFHFIRNDNVQKGVSLFADEHNADMVLILPRKHGLFHRSDSKQFIFHSPVPVMAIHEG